MTDKRNIILCIESTGTFCSVALAKDRKCIDIINEFDRNVHDEKLAENIRVILSKNNLNTNDIAAVAVSAGPGSFTGLRIGAAIAKALTFTDDIKLISLPTAEALAYYYKKHYEPCEDTFYIALLSHSDYYYCQLFDKNLQSLSETALYDKAAVEEKHNGIFGFGTGEINSEKFIKTDGITADMLIELASSKYERNDFTVSADYVPLYIQEFRINKKVE